MIWAPYKSNLGALFIVVSFLRGAMAPSGLLLSSATGCIFIVCNGNDIDNNRRISLMEFKLVSNHATRVQEF